MDLNIQLLIEKIKQFFPKIQAKLKAQASDLEAKIKQPQNSGLPPSQLIALKQKIADLPTPDPHRATVQSKLEEAIAQWQEYKDAPNSLVILANHLEPIAPIINETLAEWEDRHLWHLKTFPGAIRPLSYSTIKTQLAEEINSLQHTSLSSNHQCTSEWKNDRKTIIIIPDLSWYFLRCIDGLDAIEYLQELLVHNHSCFWLIGCHNCAWEYLDMTCQISAYCRSIASLSPLEDIDIKYWLSPVSKTIELDFKYNQEQQSDLLNPDRIDREEIDRENWTSSSEKHYFQHLAENSLGLSTIAARLWLRSLTIQEAEDDSDSKDSDSKDTCEKTIILERIPVPDLPELTKNDRYLLFSLCLHGELTLPNLALSLGESKPIVQNQIQALCKSEIVELISGFFLINPVYYPRLRKHLANYHFPIGDR